MAETNNLEELDVECKTCESRNWTYMITHAIAVATGIDQVVNEEIRCARCRKKANLQQTEEIRRTEQFQQIRLKEVIS